MFEEPSEVPSENTRDPKQRAREKGDELRVHAELAAVFEGVRKFDAELNTGFDAKLARDIQQQVGRLEKSKGADSPLLPHAAVADAMALLDLPRAQSLTTNDYHIHRRPGELMIVRWLAGDEVEAFYTRMQAHFDAALGGAKEDERQANEWKQNAESQAYLVELDKVQVHMADRYLRDVIRKANACVLSTQTADEMNIAYLCDYIIGVPVVDVVGPASAPPDDPSETDLAWFFKRYSLRGLVNGAEAMCFFTFMQKSDDEFDFE